MKLFKWAEGIKPKFPKFIENLFGKKISDEAKNGENVSNVPAVNVEDDKSNYNIEVALPGMNKDDVKVEVNDHTLTISSEKQYSNEDRQRNFIRQEFAYAAFQRSFALPEDVDTDKISAKFDNGILKIGVPSNGVNKNVKHININ